MIGIFKKLFRRAEPEAGMVPVRTKKHRNPATCGDCDPGAKSCPHFEVSSDTYADPRSPEERAYVEQFSSESELDRIRRQRDEYFLIIERIEKERDSLWKMYRESVSEHLNAQALLERHLMTARQQLGRVVTALNKRRTEAGLEPIKQPKDLEPYEGEPVGTAKQYADDMIALCGRFLQLLDKAKPQLVDGDKERQQHIDPA